MAEFRKTLCNLSEADFLIISEVCSELRISIENQTVKVKPDEKNSYFALKNNKSDKGMLEISIKLDIVSEDINILNYLYFLLNKRRGIIKNLEECFNIQQQ